MKNIHHQHQKMMGRFTAAAAFIVFLNLTVIVGLFGLAFYAIERFS